MKTFNNKYRSQSHRWQFWDYSAPEAYFMTSVSCDRKPIFGQINAGEMILSDEGEIAKNHLENLNFNGLYIDQFVIMPNHIHGIIELDNSKIPEQNRKVHSFQGMIPKSLASIVKGYKIGVTKWFRKNSDIEKVWQRNYYEHIIRDQKEFETISAYIRNNPVRAQLVSNPDEWPFQITQFRS